MAQERKVCRTQHVRHVLEEKVATDLYNYLRDNIAWQDGVPSRKAKSLYPESNGVSRKAFPLTQGMDQRVDEAIRETMQKMKLDKKYDYFNIYLNYYVDGKMFTPDHSHPEGDQLVISLGATRTFTIGSGKSRREYKVNNGDAIVFGRSTHGILPEPSMNQGRISIAVFLISATEQDGARAKMAQLSALVSRLQFNNNEVEERSLDDDMLSQAILISLREQ